MSKVITVPGPLDGVSFKSKDLTPPSNVYLSPEDALVLTTYGSASSVRVDVRGELLRPDGIVVPIQFEQVPNSDRSALTTVRAVGEGFLLSVSAFLGSGAAVRGQLYTVLGLARGLGSAYFLHTILATGYIGTGFFTAWPNDRRMHNLEGPGWLRTIVGTNPAANTEITETVPTGARWRFMSGRIVLTSDANVANRVVFVFFDDGTNLFFATGGNIAQPAANAYGYYMGAVGTVGVMGTGAYFVPLPNDLILRAGYRFRTSTNQIQVTDDYGAPIYAVEEWLEP